MGKCHCQKHFAVVLFQVLLSLLALTFQTTDASQPLINQLAALLRARPPWPTNFPSGTSSTSSDSVESFQDMINKNSNLRLEDFTHFNELLTGQSINQLQQEQGGSNNNGLSLQQLYPGGQILATSHPLPQLELPNGKGKAILIAHPVLGPNPNEPPEKVEHKFNGMMIHPHFLHNDNLGLYSDNQAQQPNKPSAVRTKNNFQAFAQKFNFFQPNESKKYQQLPKVLPFSGKPPPGGKVIAIPIQVPSNSPFFFQGGNKTPQIIAMRQPFPPINYITTNSPQLLSNTYDQHVTKFMSKFSPSPFDTSSSFSPKNYTTTIPFTTNSTTAPSTSVFTYTTTPTSTTTTTTKPLQAFYSEQHTSSAIESPTPTTSSLPTPQPFLQNIQDMIVSDSVQGSPSTLVGSFRYPDPPTAPKFLNMNTHFELPQDIISKPQEWVPKPAPSSDSLASASSSTGNNNKVNSFSIPLSPKSKWKYDDERQTDEKKYRNHKSVTFSPNFKPSLQLHSFEDTTSGLREFITINPKKMRNSKSLFPSDFSKSSGSDVPSMESGFRPFNHFAFVNGVPGASISTTTESSMMNLIRNEFVKDIVTANVWNNVKQPSIRQNRQFHHYPPPYYTPNYYHQLPAAQSTSFTVGASYANSPGGNRKPGNDWVGRTESTPTIPRTQLVSGSSNNNSVKKKKKKQEMNPSSTTASISSSERYEDWIAPRRNKDEKTKRFKSPLQCEKFQRYGFCPVTLHYPLEKVESIGLRCSTLLTHLIAPLPKTDVRYDVIVSKNSSKGAKRSASGWSWKTFAGKPVCDTKEIKIVPGWAKNEEGEWLVILQTEQWKQEAQISLCANSNNENNNESPKCVQRFTAQRLVVLDPENEDRCPVVRSVFLPSACVCLNDQKPKATIVTITTKRPKHHHHKSNSTKSSQNSKVISGRSLLTTLFGIEEDSNIYPTSSSIESERDSSEDLLQNPSNSPFMVITGSESDNGSSRNINVSAEDNSSSESDKDGYSNG